MSGTEPDEALLYAPTEEGARGGCLRSGWWMELVDSWEPGTTPRGGGGGGGGSFGGKSGGARCGGAPRGLSERVASSMERSHRGTPSACRLAFRRPFIPDTLPGTLLESPLTIGGGGGSLSWPYSMPLDALHFELRELVSSDEATEGA